MMGGALLAIAVATKDMPQLELFAAETPGDAAVTDPAPASQEAKTDQSANASQDEWKPQEPVPT